MKIYFPLIAALLLCTSLRAGEKQPIEPELEDTHTLMTSGDEKILPGDLVFIERELAKRISSGTALPEDVERLRRIRNYLKKNGISSDSKSDEEKETVSALHDILLKNVVKSKAARVDQQRLAMFELFRDEPDKALRIFRNLGPASKDDLHHPMQLAHAYLLLGDYGKSVAELIALFQQIGPRVPLLMSKPVFCRNITAYRIYSEVRPNSIKAGDDILLYSEIENAAFKTDENGSVCNLEFGVAIKNELQQVLWEEPEYGSWTQRYSGPVRDLHVSISLRIPNNLTAGKYNIFITCQDILSGKSAKTFVGMQVAGRSPGKAAPESQTGEDPNKLKEKIRELQEELDRKKLLEETDLKDRQEKTQDIMQRYNSSITNGMLNNN